MRLSPAASSTSERQSLQHSTGIDTTISLSDSEPCSASRRLINQAHDIVTFLFELGPALRDPAPYDRLRAMESDVAAQPDTQHVSTKYASADRQLVDKLGYANWERRQALIRLRTRYTETSRPVQDLSHHQIAVEKLDSRILEQEQYTGLTSLSVRPSMMSVTSTATSTTQTHHETDVTFPRSRAMSTAPTDLSVDHNKSSLEFPADELTMKPQRLVVPRPPAPNNRYNGAEFLCPYCFTRLDGIISCDEWM
jgi:hypothetical protein